jgi:hypothetical protein
MAKLLVFCVLSYFLLSLTLVAAFIPMAKASAGDNLIFFEDFNGASVDTSKWNVVSDINGGFGGSISVSGSYLTLSSFGTSYPEISTIKNPFQGTTEWTLEFDITYTVMGALGAGFLVSLGDAAPNLEDFKVIAQVWNYQYSSADFYFLGFQNPDHVSVAKAPCTQTQNVKLISEQGNYELYVNGVLVANQSSTVQPDRLIIGHSDASYIPFSSPSLWCTIKINSVSLFDNSTAPETPVNSLEPTTSGTETHPQNLYFTILGIVVAITILVALTLLLYRGAKNQKRTAL